MYEAVRFRINRDRFQRTRTARILGIGNDRIEAICRVRLAHVK